MQLPLKKVTPSFPATPSQSWGPVKLSIFENLVGGSTPPAEMGGGRGAHYSLVEWSCTVVITTTPQVTATGSEPTTT